MVSVNAAFVEDVEDNVGITVEFVDGVEVIKIDVAVSVVLFD